MPFWTSTTPTGLTVLLTTDQEDNPTIEAYHLARLMGYAQQHSIRKQILTDWQHFFDPGVHFVMVHDPTQLEEYERIFREQVDQTRSVRPERGRMFLRAPGARRVLKYSSKDTVVLEEVLTRMFGALWRDDDSQLRPQVEPPRASPSVQVELPRPGLLELPRPGLLELDGTETPETPEDRYLPTLEDRKFQYRVLERLLEHLKTTTDPMLRKLALISAETAIGHRLEEVREMIDVTPPREPEPLIIEPEPVQRVPQEALDARARAARGPLLENVPGIYYGLKQIGEKAGGYSSVAAGKAADIVAARMGYTHEDIRKKALPFNQLKEMPDNTSGKLRPMYRFDAPFANRVIVELRANSDFAPQQLPEPQSFSEGGDGLPKLSRGPFDGDLEI
jgi:hypothetical protein